MLPQFDELKTMRDQRQRIEALRLHHRHQPAHSFLSAGAQRGDDFVITDAGRERIIWNLKLSRVNTEAAQRAAGSQATQSVLER